MGSQINECIDYAAGYIDVGDGCWRRTKSHQHQLVNNIYVRVVEILLKKTRNWKVLSWKVSVKVGKSHAILERTSRS